MASAKKARSATEPPCLDNIDVQWEYEEKKGHWLYYDSAHAQMLTSAFTAGEVEVISQLNIYMYHQTRGPIEIIILFPTSTYRMYM